MEKKSDTSYSRPNTGHNKRSQANKAKEEVAELLAQGALTQGDIEYVFQNSIED